MKAVSKNGCAIQFVPKEEQTEEMCEVAYFKTRGCLRYCKYQTKKMVPVLTAVPWFEDELPFIFDTTSEEFMKGFLNYNRSSGRRILDLVPIPIKTLERFKEEGFFEGCCEKVLKRLWEANKDN